MRRIGEERCQIYIFQWKCKICYSYYLNPYSVSASFQCLFCTFLIFTGTFLISLLFSYFLSLLISHSDNNVCHDIMKGEIFHQGNAKQIIQHVVNGSACEYLAVYSKYPLVDPSKLKTYKINTFTCLYKFVSHSDSPFQHTNFSFKHIFTHLNF